MSAFLRLLTKIVAFADAGASNAPSLRAADWSRDVSDIVVTAPNTVMRDLAPAEEVVFFNGSRTLTINGTTTFSLALVDGETDKYRIRHTAGTAPGFRTDRALDLSTGVIVVAVNANGIATMTVSGGPTFAGVVVGDSVYVPTLDEVGAQVFSAPNQGFWTVVAATTTVLSLTRSGDFEAAAESVTIGVADQLQVFSAAGVQVGNRLEIVSGFVVSSRRSYPIVSVTATYIEIESSLALAEETGILPTITGLLVYTSEKKLIYLETNQEVVVKLNGDTTELLKVAPWVAGDNTKPGTLQKTGGCWSLSVLNKSLVTASVVLISVE